jgi:hypothetical protein
MKQNTDDLLRAIAHNADELYSNSLAAATPSQERITEFMTVLKPGYWVLETSSKRRWQYEMSYSIGRLIWRGKLPIHNDDWEDEGKDRPLDTYTLLQLANGSFFWWWNATFIRIFFGGAEERRALSTSFASPERKREAQKELDDQNLSWARNVLQESRLSGVFNEGFEYIILDYARRNYDKRVTRTWHPWDVLSLFPAKTKGGW